MKKPLLAACAALAMFTAGCGLGTAGGYVPTGLLTGPLEGIDLSGAELSVGTKQFSEGVTMGKITVILLRSAGAEVEDLTRIPGSASARMAQLEGQVDVSWDYTGTAWLAYMGESAPVKGEAAQFEAVAERDAADNDLVWLQAAPMNNTYGFAARRDTAERLGVSTLSDLSALDPAELSFCVDSEFANRPDGFEPMLQTYDIPLKEVVPASQVKTLGAGAIYAATDEGLCNFGEVYTTDGRIEALDLVVMEDDREYFPSYNASAIIHEDVLEEYPQLRDLLLPVTERMTDEALVEMNKEVDVEGRPNADVAFEWLAEEGLISE